MSVSSSDPVLRMVLAIQARSREAYDRWQEPAWNAYLVHPDEYSSLLGDLIPAVFVEDAKAELAVRAFANGTNATAAEDWKVYLDRRHVRVADPARAVTTGLVGLNAMLGGGLRGLTFLGGQTGIGKSSFATFALRAALGSNPKVAALYLQLDMTKDDIYEQIHAAERASGGKPAPATMVSPTANADDPRPPYLGQLRILERRNLPPMSRPAEWVIDMADWFVTNVESLQSIAKADTVLIIVDNFQRLDIPDVASDLERDVLRLNMLARVQSLTASELHPSGMPILCLSKIPKGRGPTNLAPDDLHGDSDLASRASTVLFIEPDIERPAPGAGIAPVTINIAKCRDGATRGRLPLDFNYRDYVFREVQTPRVPQGSSSTRPKPSPKSGRGRAAYGPKRATQ
ncbi:MAG: hypothetical protein K8U57_02065 [Planctomycetes bacterium]|nr:hypothetical protein [Planctomycetota bacterium]